MSSSSGGSSGGITIFTSTTNLINSITTKHDNNISIMIIY